jgi:hypothetical protein
MAQPAGRKYLVCSVHIPSENFLEALLDFFGVKQFLA